MADAHKNFAYSTVATAPSPATSGTSLVVAAGDGAKFPAVPFNATIWPAASQPTAANAEIVRVTARATDTLTITRAQESSSARTVVVGDQIAATQTAKTFTDIENAIPAFAANAVVLGSSAAAGAASTVMRSDDTIAAFDATAPSTQAFGDAAAVGAAAFAARRDHKHAMPAAPVPSTARAKYGAVTQFSAPGLQPTGTVGTKVLTFNRATYFPFFVSTTITIDQIIVELTTGGASATSRFCIYPADTDWQPGTMVANTDTGTLTTTVAAQGIIATTITDTVLTPGRYLFWNNNATNNVTFRGFPYVMSPLVGYPVAMGGNLYFTQLYVAQTYGAPPSNGLAWTTADVTGGATAPVHPVFVRIKTP